MENINKQGHRSTKKSGQDQSISKASCGEITRETTGNPLEIAPKLPGGTPRGSGGKNKTQYTIRRVAVTPVHCKTQWKTPTNRDIVQQKRGQDQSFSKASCGETTRETTGNPLEIAPKLPGGTPGGSGRKSKTQSTIRRVAVAPVHCKTQWKTPTSRDIVQHKNGPGPVHFEGKPRKHIKT